MNRHWGVDRVTLCKTVKLNDEPQQSRYTLEIHEAEEAVTCLQCLAL